MAVRAYQRASQIAVDGVVGPQTWNRLLGATAVPLAVAGTPADRWVLPPDVRAAGEAQYVKYDSPPPWAGDPGNCSGTFSAGAADLRRHLQTTFPGINRIDGYACRQNTAKASETSVHGVGRALDIMIMPLGGRGNAATGDPIANWLVRNAAAIGMQYIIWNRTRWRGAASAPKDRRYRGPNPHIDHIHAELNVAGATPAAPGERS